MHYVRCLFSLRDRNNCWFRRTCLVLNSSSSSCTPWETLTASWATGLSDIASVSTRGNISTCFNDWNPKRCERAAKKQTSVDILLLGILNLSSAKFTWPTLFKFYLNFPEKLTMAKRKRSLVPTKPEEKKEEETTLPLVRTSDEPVIKKVRNPEIFLKWVLNALQYLIQVDFFCKGKMDKQTKSDGLCCKRDYSEG